MGIRTSLAHRVLALVGALALQLVGQPVGAQRFTPNLTPFGLDHRLYEAENTASVAAIPCIREGETEQQMWIMPGNLWPSDVEKLMVEGNQNALAVGDHVTGSPDTIHYIDAIRNAIATLVARADESEEFQDPDNTNPNNPRILMVPLVRPVGNPTNNGHAQQLEVVGFASFYVSNIVGFEIIGHFVDTGSTGPTDPVAPSASGLSSPKPNSAGWNSASVAVTLTATDTGGSGVASITYRATGAQSIASTTVFSASASISITAEGVTTLTYFATDSAGNVEAPKTLLVKIDRTPPTLSFGTPSATPNAKGWIRTAADIPFTAQDALSGIAPTSPPSPLHFGSDGTNQTQQVTIMDQAGNSATFTSPALNIDTTPPTITPTRSPAPNAYGWNKGSVTVSFTCSDALSGLASTLLPFVVSTVGQNQAVTRSAIDWAGNTATVTVSPINIDKVKPTLAFGTPFPAPNAAGWNNTNVSIPFTTADDLSGVATTSPSASPRVLTAQGADVKGSVTVTDKAGNAATFTTVGVRIDKTKPTVKYTGNAGTYTVDQVVSIACTPADALSGVATHTCQNISGPAYAFALGNNTFSATATDVAGNVGTGSTKFTVKVTYASLATLTRQLVSDTVVADALCARLTEASTAAAAGKSAAKKAAIDGYLAQVTAQGGKTMTAEQAAVLVRLARAV